MFADRGPADRVDARHVLPTPAGWTGERFSLGFRVTEVFLALIALGMVAGAVWAYLADEPVAGSLLAAGAVFVGHLVGFSTSVSRMRRPPGRNPTLVPSPDGTTKGVRFGYSPWPYYWLATLLIMIELSTLVLTVAVAASGTLLGIVVAVVSGALAVGVGWFLVTVLRLAPGEVTVSPAGVFHRSLTHIHFVPWYAITEVEARWLGSPIIAVKAYPSEDTGVRRYMGRFGTGELRFLPIMVIRTYWLATDPATIYHALSFYKTHPDLQAELATPAALDRIGNGRTV